MKLWIWLPAVVAVALATASCRRWTPRAAASRAQADPQRFMVSGTIRNVDREGRTLIVHHEEIPDYMAAMTMPFHVKHAQEMEGLAPGDAVSFRWTVTEKESWIEQIEKRTPAPGGEPATRAPVRLVRDVDPLGVGDLLTDYRFTNELGRVIHLSDFKGKALALTFIFTRCPMPDFCPLMSKNFGSVCRLLTANPEAPENWHLLSISFDPHFDTPAVLKRYADHFDYDPKRWNFVTGAMMDIDAITEQFDLPIAKQGENWDHKLRTVVVDAGGRVQKIFISNQWTAKELADEMVKAAGVAGGPNVPPAPAP